MPKVVLKEEPGPPSALCLVSTKIMISAQV